MDSSDDSSLPRAPLCSICGKPTEAAFKPFCSARCANVDLARWLGGAYAISSATADDDEDGEMAGDLDPNAE
jgi:uncharacterized protein